MNKTQRKVLAGIVTQLEDLRSLVESIKSDEEEKYDAMPESFQSGEKGDKMQEGIDQLDSAMDNLQSAIDDIEGIN
jgi:hypothetical protein